MRKAQRRLAREELSRSEILRYLGYRGQQPDEEIARLLEQAVQECVQKLSPAYVWEVFPVQTLPEQEGFWLEGTQVHLTGRSIGRHLQGAKKAVLLAATLGVQAERLLAGLQRMNMTQALITEAVCTEAIEKTCDAAEQEIRELAQKEGFYTKFRFSPGYGDLPLEVQPELLKALSAMKTIGLGCNESFLLIPRKSVTAVVGFFEEPPAGTLRQKCQACTLAANCEYRKADMVCGHQSTDKETNSSV